jgi:GTP pyrophosphokinase
MSDLESNPPTPIEEILAEFERRRELLLDLCSKTKDLIEECLQDAGIRYQSVQARVKTPKKLRTKYLDPDKHYKRLDDITDLAALRVITYYEDEVDQVAVVLKREFEIDGINSIDKRKTDPDRFGYHAVNYVCRHLKERTAIIPYKKFAGVCCEIQITSILRHAWSEIEHDWYDLRNAFPGEIKRRFYRIAALLEIAESEFLDIRKKKSDYIKSVDLQLGADVLDVPLNPLSLRSFVMLNPVVERIDQALAKLTGSPLSDELTDEALIKRNSQLKGTGFKTIKEVLESLILHERGITEYVGRMINLFSITFNNKPLVRGVCIHNLAVMIKCSRETEENLIGTSGIIGPIENTRKQIKLAKEIMARYSS